MGTKPVKPIITDVEGKPYVRSTNFAKVFEKNHKNILQTIRHNMQNSGLKNDDFQPAKYHDLQKKPRPEFLISEDGFAQLTRDYKTEEQQRHIKRYQILFNQANKQELDIIKPSNWWGFGCPKYRMEEAFPGSIPGEIYANALYYFAPQSGKVADIMAGSGMLRRVYDDRQRWQKDSTFDLDVQLYDLHPREPFASRYGIVTHDATTPLPKCVDWIFFDPPYFGQSDHLYDGELAHTTDYQTYCTLLERVLVAAMRSLSSQGTLCVFVTPYISLNGHSAVYDTPLDVVRMATNAGFTVRQRIYVNRGEQQRSYNGHVNIKAKRLRQVFSDACELLVFTKEKEAL